MTAKRERTSPNGGVRRPAGRSVVRHGENDPNQTAHAAAGIGPSGRPVRASLHRTTEGPASVYPYAGDLWIGLRIASFGEFRGRNYPSLLRATFVVERMTRIWNDPKRLDYLAASGCSPGALSGSRPGLQGFDLLSSTCFPRPLSAP